MPPFLLPHRQRLKLTKRVIAGARRWLIPPLCPSCDSPLDSNQPFCHSCGPLVLDSSPLHRDCRLADDRTLRVSSLAPYGEPLATAIRRFKFSGRTHLARPLTRISALPPNFQLDTAIRPVQLVPVPLHYNRLVERGFNPSALLARQWAAQGLGRYAGRLLHRVRDTPQQSRATSALERRQNVHRAFHPSPRVEGKHIVLVDDVVTTGSTLACCAEALYAAGAAQVVGLCIAAAPAPAPAKSD